MYDVNRYYQETVSDLSDEKLDYQISELAGIKKPNGQVILDVGCGSGIHVDFLARKYPGIKNLVGIDSSKEMINLAERNKFDEKRVKFIVSDMSKLPFSSNYFDVVFSFNAIHYSNNLDITLSELRRVVKSGGSLFFQVVHPILTLLVKKSKDYSKKENVDFPIQGGTLIVSHPSFTFEEYLTSINNTGWKVSLIKELYGRRSKIGKYYVPSLLCFRLIK